VIKQSNVTIDGVVVLLDGSATGGGIVVDTSVARSNIAIVNTRSAASRARPRTARCRGRRPCATRS
jgi:hypothetical protein